MAVYDHGGDINSTQLDTSTNSTIVAERLQVWKKYNKTAEEASPEKRKVPAKEASKCCMKGKGGPKNGQCSSTESVQSKSTVLLNLLVKAIKSPKPKPMMYNIFSF
ncbi:Uncharacterized protein Rs2_10459 [Raphanus sativus]|nr:Uncharacterized protein Rs2_10459 [Raphanus sativus]